MELHRPTDTEVREFIQWINGQREHHNDLRPVLLLATEILRLRGTLKDIYSTPTKDAEMLRKWAKHTLLGTEQ